VAADADFGSAMVGHHVPNSSQLDLLHDAHSAANLLEWFFNTGTLFVARSITLTRSFLFRSCADVSDLNLNSMGLLSCLPYLALALSLQVSGFLADMLRGRFNIETTKVTFEMKPLTPLL